MYPFPWGSFIYYQHRTRGEMGLLSRMVFLLLRSVGSRRSGSCKFLKSRALLVGGYCDSIKVSWKIETGDTIHIIARSPSCITRFVGEKSVAMRALVNVIHNFFSQNF